MPTLSIKIGALEVSYDGQQEFIEQGLTDLVAKLSALPVASAIATKPPSGKDSLGPADQGLGLGHTTSQIAAIATIKGPGDLALAAAAHFVLVRSQETFTRSEIYDEMKGATSFVTSSYLKNLTPVLSGLVKNKRLTPISKDKYSLPAAVRKEFEGKLSSE